MGFSFLGNLKLEVVLSVYYLFFALTVTLFFLSKTLFGFCSSM